MRIKLAGFDVCLWVVGLAAVLTVVSGHAHAGALNGMDDPDRVRGSFIVVLKRDHIVSLNNPVLTDAHEIATRSEKWKAAKAAADAEVAQMVGKLAKAHPQVRISAVMSRGKSPGFVLKASEEEAKALSNEDDVAEVDADVVLKNVTLSTNQSPAPSWGLKRIDQLPSAVSPSSWINAYSWIAGGKGVNVYVLDSGIRITHVDFGGRATNDADFVGDNNLGWCASNLGGAGAGHGTEVASIIGGTTYGIAKLVSLHSVRVVDCNANSTTTNILEGLEWISARSNISSVLNISLQWIKGTLNSGNLTPAFQTFVNQSNTWLDNITQAGTSLAISSGNGGPTDDPGNSWPQDWNNYCGCHAGDEALIVGATAYNSDNIWSGTSLGSTASGDGLPNIFAPGDQVTTAWISSDTATTSSQSGTSLAAPHVAGVMAISAGVANYNDDGCDYLVACVVQYNAYSGVVKGKLQGALNYEVSSIVPGNNAPATVNPSGGGGTGGTGGTGSSTQTAPILSIISAFLLAH
jgi:subtilisin family serine protease